MVCPVHQMNYADLLEIPPIPLFPVSSVSLFSFMFRRKHFRWSQNFEEELGPCTSRYTRLSWWGNIIHLFGSTPPKKCVQALLWKARSLNWRKSHALWILMPHLVWSFFVCRQTWGHDRRNALTAAISVKKEGCGFERCWVFFLIIVVNGRSFKVRNDTSFYLWGSCIVLAVFRPKISLREVTLNFCCDFWNMQECTGRTY